MVRGDSASALQHASPERLPEILAAIGHKIGVSYYSVSSPHLRESCFDPFVVSNFPDDWQRSYMERKHFRFDPVFSDARCSTLPVFRDETEEPCDPAAAEVIAQRRALGIRSGLVVPVRGHNNRLTVFSFWSGQDLAEFREVLHPNHDFLMARLVYLHDMVGRKLAGFWREALTEIELECLKWTSLGKTAWEISVMLNIPERTVHYHLAEASKRLGAPNKTGAVGVALRNGLLEL